MDFNELLASVSRSAGRAWERVAYLSRTNRILAISLFLVLSIGLIAWARSGFTLGIGQFFAAPVDAPIGGEGGGGGGASPSVSPSASPTGKVNPWLYCDYATKTYRSAPETLNPVTIERITPLEDFEPSGAVENATCVPGGCRKWEGADAVSWKPTTIPADKQACEPLSVINATTFPGYSGSEIVKPPITFPTTAADPNCFVIQDRSSQDPNFGTMTENTVPRILQDRPNAKLFMKAFVINNCPWPVHYVLQVDLSKKTQTDNGAGKRTCGDTAESGLVKLNMPDGFDFPSCWNNALPATPANCAREISIEFDLKKFTCGSAGITTAIWHRTSGQAGGANASGERGGALQYSSHLNWGRDCTGALGERAPACGGATTSHGGGVVCTTSPLPAPPVLSVACAMTGNVLRWNNPANSCQNSILRQIDGGNAAFLAGTPSYPATTFTDTNIQAGRAYTYRVKNHPAVNSNSVTCRDGVQVTTTSPSPAVSASVSPTTSTTTSPSPAVSASVSPTTSTTTSPVTSTVPTLTSTPTPTNDPSDSDDDNDGIPDDVECPGIAAGAICPDSDNDGIPDYLDTDSDNDGIGDGQDCNRLVAGTCGAGSASTVQTGPGEATLLALIVSAVVSLLYASYTHSPLYQRREAEGVADDQGPMDFRS